MGIQELIEKVGQQNVDVQWIHESSPNIQSGKRAATIQFATSPETAKTMALGLATSQSARGAGLSFMRRHPNGLSGVLGRQGLSRETEPTARATTRKETMKDLFGGVAAFLIGIAGITLLAFGVRWGSLQYNKYFAVQEEDVRREVFKATRSYNQGMVQQLSKYRLEYLEKQREDDVEGAKAIASTIRHQFSEYNHEQLPAELSNFVKSEIFKY